MLAFIKRGLKRVPGVKALYRQGIRFSAKYIRPRANGFVSRKLLRISKELPEQQVYFSIYEIWPLAPARWVRNEQPWFRERLKNSECDEGLVHFLGAPLVERDGIAERAYLDWLRNLMAHYEGKRFIYILHPRESVDWGNKLSHALNMRVLRQKLPYEIELCMMPRRPKVVASWFCSALDNLGNCAVPNLELVAFRLPKVRLAEDKQRQGKILEAAELFYRRHEQGDKVRVLDIPGAPSAALVSVVDRPAVEAIRQFAATLPLPVVEIRAFSQGRLLLGQAQHEPEYGRLVFPCDLWLRGETVQQAAYRMVRALLGEGVGPGALVREETAVREMAMKDGKSQCWLVHGFKVELPEPAQVKCQLGYEGFSWWEPQQALAIPILGAQVLRYLRTDQEESVQELWRAADISIASLDTGTSAPLVSGAEAFMQPDGEASEFVAPLLVRPSAKRIGQFAAVLPLAMVEIRAFSQGRWLLGRALREPEKGKLCFPCGLWLKGETLQEAACRLLGGGVEAGALVQREAVIREVFLDDGKTEEWLVFVFEVVLPEPVRVSHQPGHDCFAWWEPHVALATPMLGAQTRLVLNEPGQPEAASG